MAFRRRKRTDEPKLDQLLDRYHATRPPSSTTSGVATIRCWSCHRPNLYDARRNPPSRCAWCRTVL
ncbi:MAG: hypothetical protein WAT66_05570 [Actinomycetota bacterium]